MQYDLSGCQSTDYGRGRSEVTGLSQYEVHPDLPERWKEIHRREMAGEYLDCNEDQWVQADGSRHWLHWAVHPWMDAAGAIGGIMILTEDVTARKRAEIALLEISSPGTAPIGRWGR